MSSSTAPWTRATTSRQRNSFASGATRPRRLFQGFLLIPATASKEHLSPQDVVVKNGKILLRARRSPGGDGRVYMIESKATDVAGNSATASATCVVPRHRNH